MLEKSAMPLKVKRNSLVQEGIRRLRNTKRELPWNVKADILSEFCHKMKISGYSERFRLEVIQSAVRGYDRQCDRADQGITPLHRPRSYQRAERLKQKLMTRTSWYRPANSVIFVQATPRAELVKKVQAIVSQGADRLGLDGVRAVEMGGKSIKNHLVRLDLTGCPYPDCLLCECGEIGASHTRSGAEYSGICNLCEADGKVANYEGETGRSGMLSVAQHKEAILNQDNTNAFAKHLAVFHKENAGDISAFKFKVNQTFKKCLERQVTEGVKIKNSKADIIMNSKSEYHQPAIHRITLSREITE